MNQTLEVTTMKCACEKCLCVISVEKSIKAQDGKYYCSESCSQGHPNKKGCDHNGCNCG
jgi:hypothetical protein